MQYAASICPAHTGKQEFPINLDGRHVTDRIEALQTIATGAGVIKRHARTNTDQLVHLFGDLYRSQ
jgi:hypothetical protein